VTNLRHVAALALVGWYLMAPPTLSIDGTSDIKTGRWWAKTDAPIRDWQILESLDSANDCEGMRTKIVMQGKRNLNRTPSTYPWAYAVASTQATCIATDDPRLAK